MSRVEEMAIVADINDVTFIAVILHFIDNMFLPDHYIAPFSQNFATQMEAHNFQVSPLSQNPEVSLVIFSNPGMPILKDRLDCTWTISSLIWSYIYDKRYLEKSIYGALSTTSHG